MRIRERNAGSSHFERLSEVCLRRPTMALYELRSEKATKLSWKVGSIGFMSWAKRRSQASRGLSA